MEKRIYYHDTDAGGVVYYGNYLKFLEEARTEFLEQHGLSIKRSHDLGFLYAVRECNIKYKAPARYGETVNCTCSIIKITAAQIVVEQKIINKENDKILVEAMVSLVSLTKDFKPTPIPDEVKSALQ